MRRKKGGGGKKERLRRRIRLNPRQWTERARSDDDCLPWPGRQSRRDAANDAACHRVPCATDGHCRARPIRFLSQRARSGGRPPYANCVVCVETSLEPRVLLRTTANIETQFGRTRPYPNAPRTLDI